MTACQTCGGYGNRHDPIAHDAEPTEDGLMTHDDIAEIALNVLNVCNSGGVHDPLRQAHAIAVALKLVEDAQ